jgi:hypothetical protein
MIGIVAAKLAVIAAIGSAVVGISHLNQRSVSHWNVGEVESTTKPVVQRRSSSLGVRQRRALDDAACASQSWRTTSPDCVAVAPPMIARDTTPGGNVVQSQLSAGQSYVADSGALEPSQTGTVTTSARPERRAKARRISASSPQRKSRLTVRSRMQAYPERPARKIRWAARPQRWVGYGERYSPRMAYSPWWLPAQSWREERGD